MTNKPEIISVTTDENITKPEDVYKTITESMSKEELLMRLAERENNDYLSLCNRYDIQRTITFDMAHKTVIYNFPQHKESHPIGELLILFLEAVFTRYEEERQDTIGAYTNPDTDFDLVGFPVYALPPLLLDTINRWGITPQEYSKKSVINKLVKFNIKLHPYLTFYLTDKLMKEDGLRILTQELDLVAVQNRIQNMVFFCLDADYDERLKGLTALQRYFLYKNTQLDVPAPQFMSEMFLHPGAVPEQDRHIFRTQKTMDKKEILNSTLHELLAPKPLSEEQIEYVKKLELSMSESCIAYDVQSVALLELFKMIQHNLFVKRCAYCGRYFVLRYSYENKYCDRIPEGEKNNCQILGAMRDYQQEIKGNPAKLYYKRAYKKINDYKNKGIVSEEVYKQWIPVAKGKLNDCLEGKITVEDLEKWLSDNARGVRRP
ncbi:MAG: DUF6076 domain-containing protein [Lachnospiraceae bacterium]|nr:DUF6076 domain-containing protein [Lachnospiraceae bacterium]